MKTEQVSVGSIIDNAALSRLQIITFILCGIIAILDGFDTQAIAFVAPVIARQWGLQSSSFGPVFGAGLLGLTVGALIFGPIADRFGRRTVIIWSTVMFGIFSALTPLSDSTISLIAFRFVTGLGLGGAMPNIIALTSEYSPSTRRATLVTRMFVGFPLGAVLGGLVSAPLMQRFGWEAVFYMGGILPLLLVPVLCLKLPESIRFLSARVDRRQALGALLPQIDPNAAKQLPMTFESPPEDKSALVSRLFREGRGVGTILIWIVFFANLLILYFLINWLPIVLQEAGLPIQRAVIGVVALNAGGVLGGLGLAWLCDRTNPIAVLRLTYTIAAILVGLVGFATTTSLGMVMVLIFLTGVFVNGSQFCMNALAASYYPTAIRSTGVGWALGIGRIGSVIGPVVGGIFIGLGWTTPNIFLFTAAPALLAAVCVLLLGFVSRR